MPSCVFRKCTNYSSKVDKAGGISYHMFPTNAVQLEEWIAVVRRQRHEFDWTPSKTSRICSSHFKDTDKYTSNTGRTLLKKTAVPFIAELINSNIQSCTTSIYNVSTHNMEEIFETPVKAALEKSVRVLTLKQQHLQKRNKVLAQRNRRLNKKVSFLAGILKSLKKKRMMFLKIKLID